MEMIDGMPDYNFAIHMGDTVCYYEVIADNRDNAVKKAMADFEGAHGTGRSRELVIEDNVTGFPFTKM